MKSLSFILLFFTTAYSFAQLNITVGQSPAQYVQELLGPGVTVSNVTYTGYTGQSNGTAHSNNAGDYEFNYPIHQIGSFSNGGSSNLGINEGLILSTGDVKDAKKAATFFANSYTNSNPNNDADLQALGGGQSYDLSILEFDFVPQGPSINFDFVFASEEYPNWVGAQYNDVFGFFLSGPGISGTYSNGAKNIALIPNTSLPVAISQINNGYGDCQPSFGAGGNNPPAGPCTNCTYYVSNCGGTSVAYGGFTTVLNASHAVQCGQTYHIKIAIADIKDANWDSAIFLKKNSLSSSSLSITSSINTNTSQPITICQGETVDLTVQLSGGLSNTGTYSWEHSGETTTTVSVSPTVTTNYIVTYTESGCEIVDTAKVIVASPVSFLNVNVGPCAANLYAVNGDIITTQNPATGDLIIEDCNGNQTVIASAPFTGNTYSFNLNGLTANGNNCVLTAYFSVGNCEETYNFNAPSPCNGCENVTITYTANPTNATCGNDDGKITLTGAGGASPYSYSIDNGTTFQNSGTFTDLPTGSYNIVVTDNNGCTTSGTESIGNANGPSITNTLPNNPSCFGACDGSMQVTVTGGAQPYVYQWFDNLGNPIGTNSNSIVDLCDGTYSVQVMDDNNCATTSNFVLTQPAVLNANFTGINPNYCNSDPVVSLIPTQSGGTFSGPGVNGNTFNPNSAGNGTHVITYTIGNSASCTESHTVTVIVSGPSANFTADPMVTDVSNTEVNFDNLSTGATSYTWDFGDNSLSSDDTDPTHIFPSNLPNQYTVTLTVSDNFGCTAIKSTIITITALEMEYEIPNIFTPNDDKSNDYFHLIQAQNVVGIEVIVLNRWGRHQRVQMLDN